MIYLDHNATTPLKPAVRSAMTAAMEISGNPSSLHQAGRAARRWLEAARHSLADALGVRPSQVIFTSGGTEANATALHALPAAARFVSAAGHDSLRQPGAIEARVNQDGTLDLAALEDLLAGAERPALLALALVNNETGVIQPLEPVRDILRRYGAWLHIDAVQALGKIPLSFPETGAQSLAVSAHKIGGPKGMGALLLGENQPFEAFLTGGGQERRRRAGTENFLGIAGFGAALQSLGDDIAACRAQAAWRDAMEDKIAAAAPDAVFPGRESPRAGNTSCILMPGIPAETQLMHFDLAGMAVSSGAACSSGKLQASRALKAMGYSDSLSRSALRISGGLGTLREDYLQAADIWLDLWRRGRKSM